MIDSIRRALALRSALRAVRARQPAGMRPAPGMRTALVVLPEGREATEAAWAALGALGLEPDRVRPVATGAVSYVPDRYAGRILVTTPRGVLRLPPVPDREACWDGTPDVAINLLPAAHPAGALLVGASPAALRVGFSDRKAEPFYDMLVGAAPGAEPGPETVARMIETIHPSLFRAS